MEKAENHQTEGIGTIDKQSFVSDIVKKDYRTAAVFRRYGIEYCCGAKFPLEMICSLKNLDPEDLLVELNHVSRTITISNTLKFEEWDPIFLADFIVNVHHEYLKTMLPVAIETIQQFAEGHKKKFNYLGDLVSEFSALTNELLTHLRYEEEIIFPYIRQIVHAHRSKESYASLLVRTLSKPVGDVMQHEHRFVLDALVRIRELTGNYNVPPDACTSHKVSFQTLQEIDHDIMQHLYLENDILFPGAIRLEKELLAG